MTPSSVTDRNPPCTAIRRSSSSVRSTRTIASSTSSATSGMCCGRMPISPTVVRVKMKLASPDHTLRSAATMSTFNSPMSHRLSLDLDYLCRSAHRHIDRKSTRLNSSHVAISYAVFCLKKKTYLLPQDYRHED